MRLWPAAMVATLVLGAGPARAQSEADVPVSGEERLSGKAATHPPPPPAINLAMVVDAVAEQRNTRRRLQQEHAEIAAERRDFDEAQAKVDEARRELAQDREVEACLKRARDAHAEARCALQEPRSEP